MIFCIGSLVSTMFQRFLQAVGDTFYSMVSLVAGAGINIILDPILIFGYFGFPALGIRGAAISTVIQIYKVGLPTIITQAIGSIVVSAVNAILISFSSTAVAFLGIYNKLQNYLLMPMNGLGQATIPIVGFCYGSRNYARIREAIRTTLPIAISISLLTTVLFMLFPSALLGLFHPSADMLQIGIPALRIISITFAFASCFGV